MEQVLEPVVFIQNRKRVVITEAMVVNRRSGKSCLPMKTRAKTSAKKQPEYVVEDDFPDLGTRLAGSIVKPGHNKGLTPSKRLANTLTGGSRGLRASSSFFHALLLYVLIP